MIKKIWRNTRVFYPPGRKTGFDTGETKLPLYWNRLFSKICLEMKIDQQLRFMVSTKKPALGTDQSVMPQPNNGTWHVEGSEIFLYHNAASKGSVLLFNAAPPRQETVSLVGKKRLQHLWLQKWLPYGRIKVWLQPVWQRIKHEKARKWWKQPFFWRDRIYIGAVTRETMNSSR